MIIKKTLLPEITNKQKEILLLLYKFRYLTSNLFQQLLSHKDKRRIQAWLNDLVDKKCIYTDYSKKEFISKPAIYCLDLKGRAILKNEKSCNLLALNKIYRDKKIKRKFINHCLTVVDVYIYFLRLQKKNTTLKFFTESELLSYDYLPFDNLDAYIAIKNNKEPKRYFLKIFDPYTPTWVYRNKVKEYLDYFNSGNWEENTKNSSFPSVLFVCPNENAKMHTYYYAKAKLEDKIKMFVTTKSKIFYNKSKESIWKSTAL